MRRGIVAVLGVLAVAWLALYLSSYGVLVQGEAFDFECTYFIGTGFHTVFHYSERNYQGVCPRLWSFGQ
jgi:hypothetical protein